MVCRHSISGRSPLERTGCAAAFVMTIAAGPLAAAGEAPSGAATSRHTPPSPPPRLGLLVIPISHAPEKQRPLKELLEEFKDPSGTQDMPEKASPRRLEALLEEYMASVADADRAELRFRREEEKLRLRSLDPDPAVQQQVKEHLSPYRETWESKKHEVDRVRAQIHQQYNVPLSDLRNARTFYFMLQEILRGKRGPPEALSCGGA